MEKKRLSLEALELENSLITIKAEDLDSYIGGTDDCVIKVFDYLDGTAFDYADYIQHMINLLGYTPATNGGVNTADIPAVAIGGDMNVYELSGGSGVPLNS